MMKKAFILLNYREITDLCWCLLNAPESSDEEEKRHIKLHARLLALQHELEQDKAVQKRKKKNED